MAIERLVVLDLLPRTHAWGPSSSRNASAAPMPAASLGSQKPWPSDTVEKKIGLRLELQKFRADGLSQARIFRIERQEYTHTTLGLFQGNRVTKSFSNCGLSRLALITRRAAEPTAARLTARPTCGSSE